MITGFRAVAQGESHKEKDLPCQDAVLFRPYPNGGVIAVADGHGSEKHFRSDTGSALAVEIAHSAITEFCREFAKESRNTNARARRLVDKKMREEQIKQLQGSIIMRWRNAVLEHCAANPLDETEHALCEKLRLDPADENTRVRFYGTTLLAALFMVKFWFVIQIGDGKCVIVDVQGKASFPGIDDEALGFGKTTSLCDSAALDNFRHIYSDVPIKGITLASDGVTDSFIPEAYLEFHETFYGDLRRNAETATGGIQRAVGVWAANGSRDDAAMAGIFEI